jgi:molybdenum cofactor synthesis domain-containing protein
MDEPIRTKGRVIVGLVSHGRVKSQDETTAKMVAEVIVRAELTLVRQVVVKGEAEHVQTLVQNVSNDNEADAIILIGGTGFGPKDTTCEALDGFLEKHIEGFAEAFRRLLRNDHGVHSLLSRAIAGVFNQCVVFAMSGQAEDLRMATELLVAPVLPEAIALAYGRVPPARG